MKIQALASCDKFLYACIIELCHQSIEPVFNHLLHFFTGTHKCLNKQKSFGARSSLHGGWGGGKSPWYFVHFTTGRIHDFLPNFYIFKKLQNDRISMSFNLFIAKRLPRLTLKCCNSVTSALCANGFYLLDNPHNLRSEV